MLSRVLMSWWVFIETKNREAHVKRLIECPFWVISSCAVVLTAPNFFYESHDHDLMCVVFPWCRGTSWVTLSCSHDTQKIFYGALKPPLNPKLPQLGMKFMSGPPKLVIFTIKSLSGGLNRAKFFLRMVPIQINVRCIAWISEHPTSCSGVALRRMKNFLEHFEGHTSTQNNQF